MNSKFPVIFLFLLFSIAFSLNIAPIANAQAVDACASGYHCDPGLSCHTGETTDNIHCKISSTSSPEGDGMCCSDSTNDTGAGIKLDNPLGNDTQTVAGLLEKIVNWLITIGGPIAVGFIIWGALQMVFAAGDPEKFKQGRQTIFYTVIGYAIILIGRGITSIIKSVLQ